MTDHVTAERTRLFERNLAAVGGRVVRVALGGLVEAVQRSVPDRGSVLVSPELSGLAPALARLGVEAHVGLGGGVVSSHPGVGGAGDTGAPPSGVAGRPAGEDLETLLRRAHCGVVLGVAGVAASGTVMVGPGGGNGGLLASLPPHTVVLLPEDRIFSTLAEALSFAWRSVAPDGELMLITGPSRTADIEMMSVTGVHGPLGIDVILVHEGVEGVE